MLALLIAKRYENKLKSIFNLFLLIPNLKFKSSMDPIKHEKNFDDLNECGEEKTFCAKQLSFSFDEM